MKPAGNSPYGAMPIVSSINWVVSDPVVRLHKLVEMKSIILETSSVLQDRALKSNIQKLNSFEDWVNRLIESFNESCSESLTSSQGSLTGSFEDWSTDSIERLTGSLESMLNNAPGSPSLSKRLMPYQDNLDVLYGAFLLKQENLDSWMDLGKKSEDFLEKFSDPSSCPSMSQDELHSICSFNKVYNVLKQNMSSQKTQKVGRTVLEVVKEEFNWQDYVKVPTAINHLQAISSSTVSAPVCKKTEHTATQMQIPSSDQLYRETLTANQTPSAESFGEIPSFLIESRW